MKFYNNNKLVCMALMSFRFVFEKGLLFELPFGCFRDCSVLFCVAS
uniref:Uncharacterized protein n=1 Tax=Manihot esculenta TaxID=3983 RepID=A0A2C9VJM7_MANES